MDNKSFSTCIYCGCDVEHGDNCCEACHEEGVDMISLENLDEKISNMKHEISQMFEWLKGKLGR